MIHDIFAQTSGRYSKKIAVADGEIRLTYNDLFMRKEIVLQYLKSFLRIRGNEKIAIFLPNCYEYICLFFAAAELGAVTIPLNINWKESELQYFVDQCHINTVVTHGDLLSHWGKIPSLEKGIRFVFADEFISPPLNENNFSLQSSGKFSSQRNTPDTEVIYLCTSGSTGRPKIIPKTHAPLIAGAINLGRALAITSRDRFLAVVPFFHANGFENSMLLPIIKGASVVIMRKYHPRNMLHLLENEGITILIGSPFIFSSLIDVADKTCNFSSIRFCLSAGAPLPDTLRKTFFSKFGIPIRGHYGASETGPLSVQLQDLAGYDRSVGQPFDNVSVKIIGEDGGELPPGSTGEILIRSNSMIKGYLGDADLNDKSFMAGYFRIGDLGMLDNNGNIHIFGRKQRVINAAGNKIDPVEIRNVLLSFPKVEDAFVTGITNKKGMDMLKAIVVAQPDCTVNEIIIFCKEHLAEYKIPRIVEFRDKIPTDLMGKVVWHHE